MRRPVAATVRDSRSGSSGQVRAVSRCVMTSPRIRAYSWIPASEQARSYTAGNSGRGPGRPAARAGPGQPPVEQADGAVPVADTQHQEPARPQRRDKAVEHQLDMADAVEQQR